MQEFKITVKTPAGVNVPSTVTVSDNDITVTPDGSTVWWIFNLDLTPRSIIKEECGNEIHITHDGKDLFESVRNNMGGDYPVKSNGNYDDFIRDFETPRAAIEQAAFDPSFPSELRELLKQDRQQWSPMIRKLSSFAAKTARDGRTG